MEKINIKAKDFADKETLEKNLSNKLKKPLQFLEKNRNVRLPFCYEVALFESGGGFLSIGLTKEVQRIYSMERCKGKGSEGKIDKKKVAMGEVALNDEGIYEFFVQQGTMKRTQAKEVIKSIELLKKKVKEKFVILGGEVVTDTSTEEEETETTTESDTTTLPEDQQSKIDKMKENLQTLSSSIGKVAQEKIQSNLDRFNDTLERWKKSFHETANEALDEAQEFLKGLQDRLNNNEEPTQTITPEQRVKMNDNLDLMANHVNQFLKQLEEVTS